MKKVLDGLKMMYKQRLSTINTYSIVGHSCGGKVALLVASIIDPMRVSAVVALDPVDINPVEFTKNETGPNLPLDDDGTDERYDSSNNNLEPTLTATCSDEHVDDDYVHVKNDVEQTTGIAEEQETVSQKKHHHILILTCTDGGRGIPKSHNAESIHKLHPATIYYHHAHSGHMAHCDNGGGKLAGKLMPDVGTKEGNEQAREAAHTLIKQILTQ